MAFKEDTRSQLLLSLLSWVVLLVIWWFTRGRRGRAVAASESARDEETPASTG